MSPNGIILDGGNAAGGSIKNVIKPGKEWLDTSGKPIQGHGGCILEHKGVYYWYGEVKKGETYKIEQQFPAHIDFIGIACYSSKDLVNWKFESYVIKASNDKDSPLYKLNVLERPKVIYNEEGSYFVMWMHFDEYTYYRAQVGVAKSDSPTGPFEFLNSFNPHNRDSRDMTVFKDNGGKAYLFYSSNWNRDLYVTMLTPDYLNINQYSKKLIENQSREAPAIFKHGTRYLMLTSGCTGWQPNEARFYASDRIFGPWKDIGAGCMGTPDQCSTTFSSQDAFVLPLDEKRGLYLMMADRWNGIDLEQSTYVWLPLFVFDERVMNPIKGQDRVQAVMLWLS